MKIHLLTGAVVVGLLSGCGGGIKQFDTVKVSGTVYLDGEPHGPATLMLYPVEGMSPTVTGAVAADGTYTLTTYNDGDGAPPGDYSASLTSGSAGDGDMTDPAVAMAAMSGPLGEPISITIPAGGSDNLEMRFEPARASSPGSTLLGN